MGGEDGAVEYAYWVSRGGRYIALVILFSGILV